MATQRQRLVITWGWDFLTKDATSKKRSRNRCYYSRRHCELACIGNEKIAKSSKRAKRYAERYTRVNRDHLWVRMMFSVKLVATFSLQSSITIKSRSWWLLKKRVDVLMEALVLVKLAHSMSLTIKGKEESLKIDWDEETVLSRSINRSTSWGCIFTLNSRCKCKSQIHGNKWFMQRLKSVLDRRYQQRKECGVTKLIWVKWRLTRFICSLVHTILTESRDKLIHAWVRSTGESSYELEAPVERKEREREKCKDHGMQSVQLESGGGLVSDSNDQQPLSWGMKKKSK